MIYYKKPILITAQNSLELFEFFDFVTFNLNQNSLEEAIQKIAQHLDNYAIIFITTEIKLSQKQKKLLDSLNIPISILPINPTDSGVAELKHLTEKAVGMNLENLFTS